MCNNGKCKNPKAPCSKCKISMARKKHHGHHKTHHLGGKKRKRSRVSGFSKMGFTEAATIGGTALVTKVALDYATPKLVAMSPTMLTPTVVNYGKLVLGLVVGSMAEGKAKHVIQGVAAGMILDGGSKIADSMINGTAMIAGVSQPVVWPLRNTIGRVAPGIIHPIRPTIGKTKRYANVGQC